MAKLDPDLVVRDPKSALRALQHRAVVEQHERALRHRRRHAVAVLVPCAQQKPYRTSRSHAYGYLPALEGKPVDVWVVSDLSGIIPYAWSDHYPNESYEFAPKDLTAEAKDLLVRRMAEWMARQGSKYELVFLAVPKVYLDLLARASIGQDVELRDASISACRRLGYCPKTHFRATSGAYIDYLRRSI